MKTVYRFKTLDITTGEMVIQPVKSTAERISRIPGAEIIKGSDEEVPRPHGRQRWEAEVP